MRRVGCLLLSVGLALGSGLTFASAASGPGEARTAWWSRLHQGGIDLSAASRPPSPGGLAVAATPEGATAIGGFHVELEVGDVSPVLTLAVEPSSTNAGAAGVVILACLAGAGWSAGDAQSWDAAPPAACLPETGGASIAGQRNADGTAYTFPLGALQLGTVVDVIFVPASAAGAAVVPFQVNFAPPGPDALTISRGSTPAIPVATLLPAPPAGPVERSQTVASGGLPPTIAPTRQPAPATFTPALPVANQQLTATAPVVQLASTPELPTVLAPDAPWWIRALGVLQAMAAVGLAVVAVRRQPGDDGSARGLGPFRSDRQGTVPAL